MSNPNPTLSELRTIIAIEKTCGHKLKDSDNYCRYDNLCMQCLASVDHIMSAIEEYAN